jgi:hypothetical protein
VSDDNKDRTVLNEEEFNKILIRKSQRKRSFVRPKRRREDDFKVHHREVKDVKVWSGFVYFRLKCRGGLLRTYC